MTEVHESTTVDVKGVGMGVGEGREMWKGELETG